MQGTYRHEGGGPGNGSPVADLPWNVSARVAVNSCTHEDFGTAAANPKGTATLTPKALPMKRYDIDVAINDENTMLQVSDGMPDGEGGHVTTQPKVTKRENDPGQTMPECPQCGQPTRRVSYKVKTLEVVFEYQMTMPKWLQSANAGANAQQEWMAYYNALLAHENGHVNILTTYCNGEGKVLVEQVVDDEFWGMAHNADRAIELALRPYEAATLTDLLLELHEGNSADQTAYDANTQHGQNQQAVGGTNIPFLNPAVKVNE